MRYTREKPNSRHWEKKRTPMPQVIHRWPPQPFSDEAIAAMLAASRSLDELCAANGHRFREDITSGESICVTCGRTTEECAAV